MKFDLHKPCELCPFRTNCPPAWLGHDRAEQIAQTLDGGNTFTCHKTGRNEAREGEQHCAGALIVLHRDQGGFSGALSVACALGWLDWRALDGNAPVFQSLEEFIDHHTNKEKVSG